MCHEIVAARATSAATKNFPALLTLLPNCLVLDKVQAGTKYKTILQMTNESNEPLKVRIKIPDTLYSWVSVQHDDIAKQIVFFFFFFFWLLLKNAKWHDDDDE